MLYWCFILAQYKAANTVLWIWSDWDQQFLTDSQFAFYAHHPPSSQLDLARPGSAGVGGNPMEGQSTNTISPQLKTELLVLNLLITPSNTPASHFKSLRKLKTNQGVVPGFWFLLCILVSMLVSPGLPPPTVAEVYTIIYIWRVW